MDYFSYISYTLSMSNKLEKAIYEFIKTKERKVVDGIDIFQFRSDIIAGIKKLNQEHPRCKPRNVEWYQPEKKKGDWFLHGVGFCTLVLYATKI